MADEFALCWNNFSDNLTSGFQNLFDRGDFVDCTIACDGKILQAHKIVMAICSPYFQEIFLNNPCKHPIIILKDVTFSIMSELLQFMYQGEVNVKHSELQQFMKIAETLQIKGLTTHTANSKGGHGYMQNNHGASAGNGHRGQHGSNNHSENHHGSSMVMNSSTGIGGDQKSNSTSKLPDQIPSTSQKRQIDPDLSSNSFCPKQLKQIKRSLLNDINDNDMNESIDMTTDDVFMPPVPQVTMNESRYDVNNVKREGSEVAGSRPQSPVSMRGNFTPNTNLTAPFNFDFPTDFNNSNDFGRNHMDIPAGTNLTMLSGAKSNVCLLSATSLLFKCCIYNKNNTQATLNGLKTYWLCKSYRMSICRARCITHQGKVISATGVHNHEPHIKGPNAGQSQQQGMPQQFLTNQMQNMMMTSNASNQNLLQNQQMMNFQSQVLHNSHNLHNSISVQVSGGNQANQSNSSALSASNFAMSSILNQHLPDVDGNMQHLSPMDNINTPVSLEINSILNMNVAGDGQGMDSKFDSGGSSGVGNN